MKKVLALALAAVMVMALCGVAFAAAADNVTVKITGIEEGNKLLLYKLFGATIGDNNTITYTPTSRITMPEAYDTIAEIGAISSNSDAANTMAKTFGALFGGLAGDYEFTAGSDDYAQGDVAPGYYYAIVKGTADTGVVYKPMLINAVPVPNSSNGFDAHDDIDTAVKKEPITITKQEETSPTDDTLVKTTDGYCIGDNIDFVITTKIPNYPSNSKYATVIITDAPTGLVDDIASVVVKVGDTVITTTNYDVERRDSEDTTGFKVTLKDKAFILAHANEDLIVTYTAKLVGPAQHTTNTATLTYNPNPYENTTVTPPDTTDQYTYGFVFNKTDASHNGLAGATFALFDAAGTAAITDVAGNALTFTTTVESNKAYVYWEGLAAGTYTVKETNAPAGYTPVADFTVTLSSSVCTGDNPATDTTENYYLVMTDDVVNNPGAELPSTGGIGTTIFYVSGLIMVLGASIILISRRRAEAK